MIIRKKIFSVIEEDEERLYSSSDIIEEQREFGHKQKMKRKMSRAAKGMHDSAFKAEKSAKRAKEALDNGNLEEAQRLLDKSKRHQRSALGSAERVATIGDKITSKNINKNFDRVVEFGPSRTPTSKYKLGRVFLNPSEKKDINITYGQGQREGYINVSDGKFKNDINKNLKVNNTSTDTLNSYTEKKLKERRVEQPKTLVEKVVSKSEKKPLNLKRVGKYALGTATAVGTIYAGKKAYDHYKNKKK